MTRAAGRPTLREETATTVAQLPITLLTRDDLIRRAFSAVAQHQRLVIYHVNARLIHLANRTDQWLLKELRRRDTAVICDSTLPQLFAKFSRQPVPERLAFNRWMDQFLLSAIEQNVSVYFLGSTEQNLHRLKVVISARFPELRVAGMTHGYLPLFDPAVGERVVDDINRSRADVLFVGLGMPVQERWIADQRDRLSAAVILPCGGALDFLSGAKPTAPAWVSRVGLEWVFRAFLEPRRLLRRNLIDNGFAMLYFLKNLKALPSHNATAG